MTGQINLSRNITRTSLHNTSELLANSRNFKESLNISKRQILNDTTKSRQWMKNKSKSTSKRSSSATLSFMVNSWGLTGQVLIKLKTKSKFKSKIKTFLEIKKKKRSNKTCGSLKKSYLNYWTSSLKRLTLSLMIRWEKSFKKHACKKSSSKRWNFSKKLCPSTQSRNSTFLSKLWPINASMLVKNRSIRFSRKSSERSKRPNKKRKEPWKR